MKVLAINGSPRKGWNTETLLQKALEGAASQGAQTEIIHPYDLQYRGCTSCLACKRKGAPHICFMRDELTPILQQMMEADVLIFGSPVYFHGISSGLSALLERFVYPSYIYNRQIPTVYEKTIPSAFVYTMNSTEEQLQKHKDHLNPFEKGVATALRCEPALLYACNTWQYTDYDLYEHAMFSVESKKQQRAKQFPADCQHAFDLGVALVQKAAALKEK